jgi:hypothetical protein
MSEGIVDEIAPDTLAQKRLTLSVDSERPLVGSIVLVSVDYTGAEPEGIVLPLIYSVTQPDGTNLVRRLMKIAGPRRLSFQPELPGRHFVRLGEAFHNRWWGSVYVDVEGGSV